MFSNMSKALKIFVAIVIGIIIAFGAIAIFSPQTLRIKGDESNKSTTEEAKNLESGYLAEGASKDTILVKFKSNVGQDKKNEIHAKLKTKTKSKIAKLNTEVVSIPSGSNYTDTIGKFKKYSEVEYAEPNYLAAALMTPNDPLYNSQWGLKKISAPAAWDNAKGGGISVAVVDTGVLSTHPDLSGEVTSGYNFVSSNTNTTDDHGHGTHVSGIVAGMTNNGIGVASIGYKATIIPVKVLNSSGSGTYAAVSSGIVYAADRGAKIINLSLGGPSPSTTLQNAVTYAVNKGVYVVAARGNSASSAPLYPASCKGALAVTATDSSDNLASFSSYGSDAFIAAPGVNILSTSKTSSYVYMSGTSMATPHFAGLLELALSYISSSGKSVSNTQLMDYIKETSDNVGSYSYDSSGWNQYFGYGRINAEALINKIKGETPEPAPEPSPSPEPTPTPTNPSRSKIQFDVVISGNIDYIDTEQNLIKIKVKTTSNSLKLSVGDLVNIYADENTIITSKGKNITIDKLKIGNKINIKATWADDKLTASSIKAQ